MRDLALVFSLALATVLAPPALPQTPDCAGLTGPKRELSRRLLESEHVYDCCDDTIANCLRARPTCALAVRLASNLCRRVAAGQDETRIRRSLSRRARSMMGGLPASSLNIAQAAVAGPREAPVTVVVFACARCPYCSRLIPRLHGEIQSGRLKGKVRMAFLVFPIRGHVGSTEAGLAFTAAARMGRFWEYALHAYRSTSRARISWPTAPPSALSSRP